MFALSKSACEFNSLLKFNENTVKDKILALEKVEGDRLFTGKY